jgi:hypothetical protein
MTGRDSRNGGAEMGMNCSTFTLRLLRGYVKRRSCHKSM